MIGIEEEIQTESKTSIPSDAATPDVIQHHIDLQCTQYTMLILSVERTQFQSLLCFLIPGVKTKLSITS